MPQFKNMQNPPPHQFVTFSVIDDNDRVQHKFAQCNNCGVIHKITDICKSEILSSKEDMGSILKIDDIKPGMPPNLSKILEINDADLPSWEYANFIFENKLWGNFVVLTSDVEQGTRHGKYVQILGENLFKVNTFSREEIVKG
jgi:hypothetical protein